MHRTAVTGGEWSPQCLSWTATIDDNNFTIGGPPLAGSSLARVVSSLDIVRSDGLRCSACHYQNASGVRYQPAVPQNSTQAVDPYQSINGYSWAQVGGWADQFLQRPTDDSGTGAVYGGKPTYLKFLMQTWIDDGRNPGNWLYYSNVQVATGSFSAN